MTPKIFVSRNCIEALHNMKEVGTPPAKFDRRCSNFLRQVQHDNQGDGEGSQASPTRTSQIVAISPSKQMMEHSNLKNPFAAPTIIKTTFMNTRPMFLGPHRSRQTSHDAKGKQAAETNAFPGSKACSQERLESREMREAIYESHGIMTSADKNVFKGQTIAMQNHETVRKAHRFASGGSRHHSVNDETCTNPVDHELQDAPPLTVRVMTSDRSDQMHSEMAKAAVHLQGRFLSNTDKKDKSTKLQS